MKNKIIITGASGFIGSNLKKSFDDNFDVVPLSVRYKKKQKFNFNADIIIHLAGIAHDLNNSLTYENYHKSNFLLTKQLFSYFLKSDSSTFIFISSVKAVSSHLNLKLNESFKPNPTGNYGRTKYLSEKFILNSKLPNNKKFFILRPCMIHGPNNKGNFNLLYKFCCLGLPWPLGSFENKRSYCSIDNFTFLIRKIILNKKIKSNVFNLSDDDSISTNEIIKLVFDTIGKKPIILKIPKIIVKLFTLIGDIFNLSLNSNNLNKLTETYEVSNSKIKNTLAIDRLPINCRDGLQKTFDSFLKN